MVIIITEFNDQQFGGGTTKPLSAEPSLCALLINQ